MHPLRTANSTTGMVPVGSRQAWRHRLPGRLLHLILWLSLLQPLMARAEQPDLVLMVAASNDARQGSAPQPAFRNTIEFVERELGVGFEVRRYPWKRLIQNLNSGEGLAFGLSKNAVRLQTLHFSEPVYVNYVWLVTRSDAAFPFSAMPDLKGKSLGVSRGSSFGDEFDRQKNILFTAEEDAYGLQNRLNKLLSKRMDAIVYQNRNADPEQVEAMLNRLVAEQMPEIKLPPGVTFRVLRKPLMTDNIHFAIRAQDDDGIIKKINAVIARGKKTGELARALSYEQ
ncbi:substrate-binding periplasmic protein [Undibacterium sp.]|jgi:polar amino acid transport system substrate-binding protein|uniref:substrate-binding periplasmic protein n=1 Tax=Undibacterium sp. TaxID=1914977 RepID=UPI002BCC896C|nr:transporter substrate-binding domain-containing protein [Undibacterium sp.]HTD06204.1 transporter substrate-binding domain-containing protein [Undibacterium sp.]